MLIKILGVLDFISALILILVKETQIPYQIFIFFGLLLLIKSSFGKLKDFASWIDFASGITLILLIFFNVPIFITIILGLLLFQKSIFSFI